jgi:hypothetical protein
MGGKTNACGVLLGNPEGKKLLRRQRCRWVNNIKMDFGETGWGLMHWIHLALGSDQWKALV